MTPLRRSRVNPGWYDGGDGTVPPTEIRRCRRVTKLYFTYINNDFGCCLCIKYQVKILNRSGIGAISFFLKKLMVLRGDGCFNTLKKGDAID